jgi:DNA-binding response OmpR family regulator
LLTYFFKVTVTENGKAAYEELKDENKDFDLVLLDLYMPELDGFELLSLMQEDERLRTIPVVVMTANDTNDIAANCLKMGAVNFLVKPIRIQECKALVKHMKQTHLTADKIEKGLFKYENIRPLGKGAAGSVNLVRNKLDGKEYALKTINLTYLNEKDKKSAENEI